MFKKARGFFVLLAFVLQACAAATGVKPTDLSVLKTGATLSEVEATLGRSLNTESTKYGKIAKYNFNRGAAPILKEGDYGYALLMLPIALPLMTVKGEELKKGQREELYVAYGRNDDLLGFFTDREDAADILRLVNQAAQGNPEAQYQLSGRIRGITGWQWLCRAAQGGHPGARFQMAQFYLLGQNWPIGSNVADSGELPSAADFSRALLWSSLAERVGLQQVITLSGYLRSKMSVDEISKVEHLVADWEPNQSDCEKPPLTSP